MFFAPEKRRQFYENESFIDIWGFVRTAFDRLWLEHTHCSPYGCANQYQRAD
jgi:hypothetical protein